MNTRISLSLNDSTWMNHRFSRRSWHHSLETNRRRRRNAQFLYQEMSYVSIVSSLLFVVFFAVGPGNHYFHSRYIFSGSQALSDFRPLSSLHFLRMHCILAWIHHWSLRDLLLSFLFLFFLLMIIINSRSSCPSTFSSLVLSWGSSHDSRVYLSEERGGENL